MATPTAYGFARISHEDQEGGDSVPAQVTKTERYYRMALEDKGVEWGGCYHDHKHVSVFKTPFVRQAVGKKLMKILKPGDHLIVDKLDRIYRSVKDFVPLMEDFKRRNIRVHFVDLMGCSVAVGTPAGDFMLIIMVATAELESKRTSERIRQQQRHRRENGMFWSGKPPIGCKKIKGVLHYDKDKRHWMSEIVLLRDEHDLSFDDVSERIEHLWCAAVGKKFRYLDRYWTPNKVRRAYKREKMYRRLGNPDPNTIDFKKEEIWTPE